MTDQIEPYWDRHATNYFREGWKYLGRYSIHRKSMEGGTGRTWKYDLYAIEIENEMGDSVSFGARYGNGDKEYLSGDGFRLPSGTWDLYVSGETAIAAARYFAQKFEYAKNVIGAIDRDVKALADELEQENLEWIEFQRRTPTHE